MNVQSAAAGTATGSECEIHQHFNKHEWMAEYIHIKELRQTDVKFVLKNVNVCQDKYCTSIQTFK